MLFIKKLVLGLTALVLIFIGGNGTQSGSMIMQGVGFVGIIIGFVVLYIFGKMVWRAMGCLPSLIIICVVVGFVLFAIGAFNGGVENVVTNIQTFLGQNRASSSYTEQQGNAALQLIEQDSNAPIISENFSDILVPGAAPVPEGCPPAVCPPAQAYPQPVQSALAPQPIVPEAAPQPVVQPQPVQHQMAPQPMQPQAPQESSGGFMKMVSNLTGAVTGAGSNSKQASHQISGGFNPNNYPAVYGVAKVINGDTIDLRGRYLKLFGVAAPISNQTCADSKGRSYACGQEAARWLKSWISGHELECRVIQQDGRGNMVGTCSFGQYDVGAALVNAGWAVANSRVTDIYLAYQTQAQANGRGLWQGQFYMPWDWKEIQSKKPKIKVIRPKKPKQSILDM